MKARKYTQSGMVLSVILLLIWGLLGTTATLAWFTDTSIPAKNTFMVGDLSLDVSFKNDTMTQYAPLQDNTEVFCDGALYEPGYTQVVYVKITNTGNVDFNYKFSVDMIGYQDSVSVKTNELHLPEYLRFGVIFDADEAQLDRTLAQANATEEMESYCMGQFSKIDTVTVAAGQTRYAALVVYMPEEVGNEANYRGQIPGVDLGITVYAQQAGTPMN